MNGQVIAILGIALCAITCGIGSALGLKYTGSAAAGVMAEEPKKFSRIIVLVLLPATQGLYGLLIAFMAMSHIPGADAAASSGWSVFGAVLPMMIVGFASAILQGQTSVAAINAVGKKSEIAGKLIMFPAMVETYALLALVVSILLLQAL